MLQKDKSLKDILQKSKTMKNPRLEGELKQESEIMPNPRFEEGLPEGPKTIPNPRLKAKRTASFNVAKKFSMLDIAYGFGLNFNKHEGGK